MINTMQQPTLVHRVFHFVPVTYIQNLFSYISIPNIFQTKLTMLFRVVGEGFGVTAGPI